MGVEKVKGVADAKEVKREEEGVVGVDERALMGYEVIG